MDGGDDFTAIGVEEMNRAYDRGTEEFLKYVQEEVSQRIVKIYGNMDVSCQTQNNLAYETILRPLELFAFGAQLGLDDSSHCTANKRNTEASPMCLKSSTDGGVFYKCLVCTELGFKAVLCKDCFINGPHIKHRHQVLEMTATTCFCMCGVPKAWNEHRCDIHSTTGDGPSVEKKQTDRAELVFNLMLWYAVVNMNFFLRRNETSEDDLNCEEHNDRPHAVTVLVAPEEYLQGKQSIHDLLSHIVSAGSQVMKLRLTRIYFYNAGPIFCGSLIECNKISKELKHAYNSAQFRVSNLHSAASNLFSHHVVEWILALITKKSSLSRIVSSVFSVRSVPQGLRAPRSTDERDCLITYWLPLTSEVRGAAELLLQCVMSDHQQNVASILWNHYVKEYIRQEPEACRLPLNGAVEDLYGCIASTPILVDSFLSKTNAFSFLIKFLIDKTCVLSDEEDGVPIFNNKNCEFLSKMISNMNTLLLPAIRSMNRIPVLSKNQIVSFKQVMDALLSLLSALQSRDIDGYHMNKQPVYKESKMFECANDLVQLSFIIRETCRKHREIAMITIGAMDILARKKEGTTCERFQTKTFTLFGEVRKVPYCIDLLELNTNYQLPLTRLFAIICCDATIHASTSFLLRGVPQFIRKTMPFYLAQLIRLQTAVYEYIANPDTEEFDNRQESNVAANLSKIYKYVEHGVKRLDIASLQLFASLCDPDDFIAMIIAHSHAMQFFTNSAILLEDNQKGVQKVLKLLLSVFVERSSEGITNANFKERMRQMIVNHLIVRPTTGEHLLNYHKEFQNVGVQLFEECVAQVSNEGDPFEGKTSKGYMAPILELKDELYSEVNPATVFYNSFERRRILEHQNESSLYDENPETMEIEATQVSWLLPFLPQFAPHVATINSLLYCRSFINVLSKVLIGMWETEDSRRVQNIMPRVLQLITVGLQEDKRMADGGKFAFLFLKNMEKKRATFLGEKYSIELLLFNYPFLDELDFEVTEQVRQVQMYIEMLRRLRDPRLPKAAVSEMNIAMADAEIDSASEETEESTPAAGAIIRSPVNEETCNPETEATCPVNMEQLADHSSHINRTLQRLQNIQFEHDTEKKHTKILTEEASTEKEQVIESVCAVCNKVIQEDYSAQIALGIRSSVLAQVRPVSPKTSCTTNWFKPLKRLCGTYVSSCGHVMHTECAIRCAVLDNIDQESGNNNQRSWDSDDESDNNDQRSYDSDDESDNNDQRSNESDYESDNNGQRSLGSEDETESNEEVNVDRTNVHDLIGKTLYKCPACKTPGTSIVPFMNSPMYRMFPKRMTKQSTKKVPSSFNKTFSPWWQKILKLVQITVQHEPLSWTGFDGESTLTKNNYGTESVFEAFKRYFAAPCCRRLPEETGFSQLLELNGELRSVAVLNEDEAVQRTFNNIWSAASYSIQVAEWECRKNDDSLFSASFDSCHTWKGMVAAVRSALIATPDSWAFSDAHFARVMSVMLNMEASETTQETWGPKTFVSMDMWTAFVQMSLCTEDTDKLRKTSSIKSRSGASEFPQIDDAILKFILRSDEQHLLRFFYFLHVVQILVAGIDYTNFTLPEVPAGTNIMPTGSSIFQKFASNIWKVTRTATALSYLDKIDYQLLETHVERLSINFLRCATLLFSVISDILPHADFEDLRYKDVAAFLGMDNSLCAFIESNHLLIKSVIEVWAKNSQLFDPEEYQQSIAFPLQSAPLVRPHEEATVLSLIGAQFRCKNGGPKKDGQEVLMCLLCGSVLCFKCIGCQTTDFQNPERNIGPAFDHALKCGAGFSIFQQHLEPNILVIECQTASWKLKSPYVFFRYGERASKNGRLVNNVFNQLEAKWFSHELLLEFLKSITTRRHGSFRYDQLLHM